MQANDRDADDAMSPGRRTMLQTAAAAPLVFWRALNSQPVAAEGKGDLVLVVGATGGIGQYAIFDLLSRGYKVRGITRRAEKVQGQVKGTELEKVEWVSGDLNDKKTLAPAMVGVKKVIFCAGAHGWEDIENNRRIYFEAVAELAKLGATQAIDRIVLVSSAGLERIKPDYSDYLKDVLQWKLKGEQAVKASGVPYSIVRAYSLDNEKDDAGDDYTVAIFQGDPDGVAGLITRKDLGQVTVEALLSAKTKDTSFEVANARKNFMGMEPDWRKALAAVQPDKPLSKEEVLALKQKLAGQVDVLKKDDVKDKPGFYGSAARGFRN